MNKYLLILIFLQTHFCIAQTGGRNTFDFLEIAGSTKVSALGGAQVSDRSEDVNAIFYNPGSVQDTLHNYISVNQTFYYGNISLSTLAYAFDHSKTGLWTFGIRYLNYGKMDNLDETGLYLGEFSAKDFVVSVGKNHISGPFSFGANMKLASSCIHHYNASALLFDLGGTFQHPRHDLTIGLAVRNIGFLLNDFSSTSSSPLPLTAEVGVTYKPEHMPVRLSVTAHHLTKGNLYEDDDNPDYPVEKPNSLQRVFSHFVIGTEIILSPNVHARLGYNAYRRKELRLNEKSGLSGISYGFMARIKAFEVSFSRNHYHVAGALNQLGVTLNLNTLIKQKKQL